MGWALVTVAVNQLLWVVLRSYVFGKFPRETNVKGNRIPIFTLVVYYAMQLSVRRVSVLKFCWG